VDRVDDREEHLMVVKEKKRNETKREETNERKRNGRKGIERKGKETKGNEIQKIFASAESCLK